MCCDGAGSLGSFGSISNGRCGRRDLWRVIDLEEDTVRAGCWLWDVSPAFQVGMVVQHVLTSQCISS